MYIYYIHTYIYTYETWSTSTNIFKQEPVCGLKTILLSLLAVH